MVIGDVDFFVKQFKGELTTASPIQSLDLGPDTNPLTFAVQLARSLVCEKMEADIVAAATAAGVDSSEYMPDRVVDVFTLEKHPSWEPMGARASRPAFRGRPAHSLLGEYEASVDMLTEKAVVHAGFMQAYARRREEEDEAKRQRSLLAASEFDGSALPTYSDGVTRWGPPHTNNVGYDPDAVTQASFVAPPAPTTNSYTTYNATTTAPPSTPTKPMTASQLGQLLSTQESSSSSPHTPAGTPPYYFNMSPSATRVDSPGFVPSPASRPLEPPGPPPPLMKYDDC